MATGILKVQGDKVVGSDRQPVILRGAGLGGWLNMENLITGYLAHEYQHRAYTLKVLGPDHYQYFFDKWGEYFFTEADAKLFSGLGLNYIRIPIYYRHFEDDMNTRVLKENHPDRAFWLWEQIVVRYKGKPWVAGYNLLNEPCDSQHIHLLAFYGRWNGFDKVLPNSVYSLHYYAGMGFLTGESLERQSHRKAEFMKSHDPSKAEDTEAIHQKGYNLLGEQLRIYNKYQIHYLQGMLHTSPESKWNRTVQSFVEKKQRLRLDTWVTHPSPEVNAVLQPRLEWIDKFAELFRGMTEKELEELDFCFHFDKDHVRLRGHIS
ncbi:glycoside hydrolase superfamily [Talaromyces proteolyticus]|uniref:Glycoside hydrolase superfamily n=1 Tax=Talaromyces proteolyticus TaxID=1131652 RepID=A0AAD4L8N5_9EURO|nr:glycoside hydrolase superfamily [Talaromyces proteolyticus]KAH8705934.1 glycoside hydrolase superfamily [Talaromyces proteolyticus]